MGVLYGLSRLSDVDDEEPNPAFDSLLDVGSDIDPTVDLVAKPLAVQLGAEQVAGPVLDTDDERAAARRVSHAGHLVCELVRRLGVLRSPRQEPTSRPASTRLLLDVNPLALGV